MPNPVNYGGHANSQQLALGMRGLALLPDTVVHSGDEGRALRLASSLGGCVWSPEGKWEECSPALPPEPGQATGKVTKGFFLHWAGVIAKVAPL